VSCYTLLSRFQLPWPLSSCLNETTPFLASDKQVGEHLTPVLGSSLIASSAYQKGPTWTGDFTMLSLKQSSSFGTPKLAINACMQTCAFTLQPGLNAHLCAPPSDSLVRVSRRDKQMYHTNLLWSQCRHGHQTLMNNEIWMHKFQQPQILKKRKGMVRWQGNIYLHHCTHMSNDLRKQLAARDESLLKSTHPKDLALCWKWKEVFFLHSKHLLPFPSAISSSFWIFCQKAFHVSLRVLVIYQSPIDLFFQVQQTTPHCTPLQKSANHRLHADHKVL